MRKKDYCKELYDLVFAMTNSERLLIIKQLKVGYSNLRANDKKMIRLFNVVRNSRYLTYERLKKKVSPNSTVESFNRLITRLTYRLEESLILEQNINRKGAYSELFRVRYKLKKLLIQAQILRDRGLITKATNILQRVRRDALKYELFDEFIEATRILKIITTAKNNIKQALSLNDELKKIGEKRKALQKISQIISDYEIHSNIKADKSKVEDVLKESIQEIKIIQNNTYTANGIALLLLLRLELAEINNDFIILIEIGNQLIELIETSPSVYSTKRLIYLNNKIARYCLFQNDFKNSLKKTNAAITLLRNNQNTSYLTATENLILVKFFLGNYNSAKLHLSHILEHELTKKYVNRYSIFSYYAAVNEVLLNSFDSATKHLSQVTEIEKDKEGWNIWVRLLRIMILMEQDKLDLIEYEIESFRKYVQRSELNSNLRINTILSILVEIVRREFDLALVSEKRSEELNRLGHDPNFKWNINSPELIQFHTWFKAKRDGVEYKPVF